MSHPPDFQPFVEALTRLAVRINAEVERGLADDTLCPEEMPTLRWRVESFRYTDQGVQDLQRGGTYTTTQQWHQASLTVAKNIEQTSEYASAQTIRLPGREHCLGFILNQYVSRLVHHRLSKGILEQSEVDGFIQALILDVMEEAVSCGATVMLDGLILQEPRVDIQLPDMRVTLRRPRSEDYEQDVLLLRHGEAPLDQPSAILDLDFMATSTIEVQRQVEKSTEQLSNVVDGGCVRRLRFAPPHRQTEPRR
jgi:hypothetical protein